MTNNPKIMSNIISNFTALCNKPQHRILSSKLFHDLFLLKSGLKTCSKTKKLLSSYSPKFFHIIKHPYSYYLHKSCGFENDIENSPCVDITWNHPKNKVLFKISLTRNKSRNRIQRMAASGVTKGLIGQAKQCPQSYDYLLILDFEATCDQKNQPRPQVIQCSYSLIFLPFSYLT